MNIRKASISDISPMIDLLQQLFSMEDDFTFNPENQFRGLALLLQSPEMAVVFVAEMDGRIVGMLTAQINISTAEGKIAATLEDMVVDKEYRRRKIGISLMNAVEEWAASKGISRLQLLVDKTNYSALSYYDQLNWARTKMICLRKFVNRS